MRTNNVLTAILMGCLLTTAACSSRQPAPPAPTARVVTKYIVNAKEAETPPGVERYCWDEPQSARAQMGPGLDEEGRWYHPSYTAVRQVRGGKWRPCRVKNSSSGTGAQYSTEFVQGE